MDTNITFEEMNRRGKEILAKQKPVTLEKARAQVQRIKNASEAHMDEYTTLNRGVVEFESHPEHMGKIEKKKAKILERITFLEEEMRLNLKQKTSNTAEISISEYTTKIQNLRKEYASLV